MKKKNWRFQAVIYGPDDFRKIIAESKDIDKIKPVVNTSRECGIVSQIIATSKKKGSK